MDRRFFFHKVSLIFFLFIINFLILRGGGVTNTPPPPSSLHTYALEKTVRLVQICVCGPKDVISLLPKKCFKLKSHVHHSYKILACMFFVERIQCPKFKTGDKAKTYSRF